MRPWQRNVVGFIRRDGKGKGVVHRETFVIKSGPGGGLEKRLRSRIRKRSHRVRRNSLSAALYSELTKQFAFQKRETITHA